MKKVLFRLLRFSGLVFLFRELLQRNKVSILVFHDIQPETAANTFAYLKEYYNIIGLKQFLKAVKQKDPLPHKALVVTFDDGHIGNYQLLPVFKDLQLPVTIFLCAGIVGTNRHFWFSYGKKVDVQRLKKVPDQARLVTLKEHGFEPTKEYKLAQALQKDHIEEMCTFVDFQSHTLFHPCLTMCTNDVANNEILESKKKLEEEYGFEINALAYPNGDYNNMHESMVKEAGYQCALTMDHGYNDCSTDLFRLKRLSVNDTTNLDELAVKSCGLWACLKSLFKFSYSY